MQGLIVLYGGCDTVCFSFSIVMLLVGMFIIGMGAYYIILLMYIMKRYQEGITSASIGNTSIFVVIPFVPFVSEYVTHHYNGVMFFGEYWCAVL